MWQKLTPIEIKNKRIEANKPKKQYPYLWKISGAALLVGSLFSILDILSHKYWFGNTGGKTFRLPWYDLSEHTFEISITFMVGFALALIIGLIAHFFDDPKEEGPTYICMKCQNVQESAAMCEICKNPKLMDFWYVKWVEPERAKEMARKSKYQ